jgi:hypothetical protein
VILEDRAPTAEDLQNECAYGHSDAFVDDHQPYAGCARSTTNESIGLTGN